MDSGTRITGGGSGYAAILAHAEGALYGTELGSVTLMMIILLLFLQKQNLAFAVYLLGSVLSLPDYG